VNAKRWKDARTRFSVFAYNGSCITGVLGIYIVGHKLLLEMNISMLLRPHSSDRNAYPVRQNSSRKISCKLFH
jgi:hypothetical protein